MRRQSDLDSMHNPLDIVASQSGITLEQQIAAEAFADQLERRASRERTVARLRLVWTRRYTIFKTAAVGFVLITVVALLIPKRFQSTTQLMPPDSDASGGLAFMAALSNQSSGLGAIASDLLGEKNTGDLFVGVLRSRTVEDRIIQRFDLKKEYGTRFDDTARKRLAKDTEISEDRKSGIITLTATDADPKRAAAVAASYVDELDLLLVQLNTSAAHRERVFLEARLNTVNQDLESAELDFSQFASKNGTLDISEQGKAMVEGEATLEGQLIAVESELQSLKQIYTDDNVRVRSTQARINELRAQLQRLGGQPEKAGSGNSGELSADAAYPGLRQLALMGVPYADKYRRFKIEEAAYEALTKQYELAKVEEAKEIPSVKVLDPAEVPEHKSFPPRLLVIFLGTVGALILGTSWILGTARWQEVDPQDPAKALAAEMVEALANLPRKSGDGPGSPLKEPPNHPTRSERKEQSGG